VDDLIDGLVRMMQSKQHGPINLGNPSEFTILELAQKVIEMTNSKSRIIHKPLPEDDPMQRRPLIELAKQYLDWKPTTSLDEGLAKTINYFKKMIGESC